MNLKALFLGAGVVLCLGAALAQQTAARDLTMPLPFQGRYLVSISDADMLS